MVQVVAVTSTLLVFAAAPIALLSTCTTAFQTTPFCSSSARYQHRWRTQQLHRLLETPTPEQQQEKQEQLKRLGFSKAEIERSTQRKDDEPVKVQVNELPNVDAVTLTAIGFGLIAANFFIFANMGDGGIAGIVATIINSLKE